MGSLSSALEETETLIELVRGSRDGMRLRKLRLVIREARNPALID